MHEIHEQSLNDWNALHDESADCTMDCPRCPLAGCDSRIERFCAPEDKGAHCFICDDFTEDNRLTWMRIAGSDRLVCLSCYSRIKARASVIPDYLSLALDMMKMRSA